MNSVLDTLGVGQLDTDGVESLVGRNENWVGTTTAGVGVFVKRVSLDGGVEDADQRVARSRTFAALIRQSGSPDLATPELIGFDASSRVLVYRLLDDARTYAELSSDDKLDSALAHRAGRATGALHLLDAQHAKPALDRSPFPFPSLGLMRALPMRGLRPGHPRPQHLLRGRLPRGAAQLPAQRARPAGGGRPVRPGGV